MISGEAESGFTLVELLISLALFGLTLTALSVWMIAASRRAA